MNKPLAKVLGALLLLAFLVQRADTALSASTVWEVRTAGSDTNGGGFVTGASGTDYSQNNNKNAAACTNCGSSTANLSTADVVCTGVATVTSATATFSSAAVGNVIFLTGTGLTTGWYQVVTFTNVTTIILDRSPGTGTGTSGIGGALATPNQAITNMTTAGNTTWIKGGSSYTRTTTITLPSAVSGTVIGYTTSRGDNGQATLTTATNSVNVLTYASNGTWTFENLIISSTAGTSAAGITNTNAGYTIALSFINCKFTGHVNGIFSPSGSNVIFGPLFVSNSYFTTNGNAVQVRGAAGNTVIVENSLFATNSNDGILLLVNTILRVVNTTFYSNSSRGVELAGTAATFAYFRNTNFVSNTSDGVGDTYTAGALQFFEAQNCVFDSNGGYGASYNATGGVVAFFLSNNSTRNNTSGAYNGFTSTNDVTPASSPFVAPGSLNFALNNTANAGKLLQGTGFPGTLQSGGSGAIDIGALQHTSSGGGAVGYPIVQ